MLIKWKLEITRVADGLVFLSRKLDADTIRGAKEKAENIIREQRIFFLPPDDLCWVLDDENNCIFREYYQRDSRLVGGNIDVYHLPKYSAIIEPLDVLLTAITDYSEDML